MLIVVNEKKRERKFCVVNSNFKLKLTNGNLLTKKEKSDDYEIYFLTLWSDQDSNTNYSITDNSTFLPALVLRFWYTRKSTQNP